MKIGDQFRDLAVSEFAARMTIENCVPHVTNTMRSFTMGQANINLVTKWVTVIGLHYSQWPLVLIIRKVLTRRKYAKSKIKAVGTSEKLV